MHIMMSIGELSWCLPVVAVLVSQILCVLNVPLSRHAEACHLLLLLRLLMLVLLVAIILLPCLAVGFPTAV
jgi:hypothetical protein